MQKNTLSFPNATGILFFLSFFLNSSSSSGQCTPTLTGPGGSITPDTTTNLPPAFAGSDYDTDIQFFVPYDTIVPVLGSVTVQDFTLTSITGLPSGFSYSSNPASGVFPGGTAGCTHFHGSAPPESLAGIYPLVVYLTAHVTFASIPIADTIYGYRIQINSTAATGSVKKESTLGAYQIFPDSDGKTNLRIFNSENGRAKLKIFSLPGCEIYSENLLLSKSETIVEVNTSDFKPGIYFFSLFTGNAFIAGKILLFSQR